MTIELDIFTGDSRVVDKETSTDMTSIVIMSGTLRAPSSVLNPVVTIDISGLPTSPIDQKEQVIKYANHAYIADFGRSYFITDKVMINDKLMQVSMSVDVLDSFHSEITALTCLVDRSESSFDLSIEDPERQFTCMKSITEYERTRITISGITYVDFSWEGLSYNIIVCCHNEHAGTVVSYDIDPPLSNMDLPTENNLNIGATSSKSYYCIDYSGAENVMWRSTKDSTHFGSAVQSMVAFPYEIGEGTVTPNAFYCGTSTDNPYNIGYKGENGKESGNSGYIVAGVYSMPAMGNDYMDYRPYSTYEIYLPFVGYKELNPFEISNKWLWVIYVVNYDNGNAQCILYATPKNTTSLFDAGTHKTLASYPCAMGRIMSVSVSNFDQNETLRKQNDIGLAVSSIGNAISVGVGIATENPLAIVGGIMGETKAISNYTQQEMSIKDKVSLGFNGDSVSLLSSMKIRFKDTKLVPAEDTVDFYNAFKKERGLPLKKVKALSTLSGMTIIESPVLDGLSAMDVEKRKIKELMRTGIILPVATP